MPLDDPTPENPEEGSLPPLDTVFDDPSPKERIYGVLVQAREPTPVQDIAERADCDVDTARKYLDWFTQFQIATPRDGCPTTYEPNEAYFQWRYVNALVEDHIVEELQENIRTLHDRLSAYCEKYDTGDPNTVNALGIADETVDYVWSDLTNWASLQDKIRLHERALQRIVLESA